MAGTYSRHNELSKTQICVVPNPNLEEVDVRLCKEVG